MKHEAIPSTKWLKMPSIIFSSPLLSSELSRYISVSVPRKNPKLHQIKSTYMVLIITFHFGL